MSGAPEATRAMLERQEAGRQTLFRFYNDLRRQARDSEDEAQHREVAEAYRAYLRSFLDADEQALLDAQDEIARLRAELARWRRGERPT